MCIPQAVLEHMSKKAALRRGKGEVRVDKISDGNAAAGFMWTWTSGNEEGLRGTTFFKLDSQGLVEYIREIAEPLFKPGDAILGLLEFAADGIEPKPLTEFEVQDPTTASNMVDYLFNVVQGGSIDESIRMFDESIQYRDFNFEEMLRGKEEVRDFIEKFNIPGITFNTDFIDDGIDSCCFTWFLSLEGAEQTIKGISFYELNPETRKISYVRDLPEAAIKPPPLAEMARQLRPGLGVFQGVPIGSRPGGL